MLYAALSSPEPSLFPISNLAPMNPTSHSLLDDHPPQNPLLLQMVVPLGSLQVRQMELSAVLSLELPWYPSDWSEYWKHVYFHHPNVSSGVFWLLKQELFSLNMVANNGCFTLTCSKLWMILENYYKYKFIGVSHFPHNIKLWIQMMKLNCYSPFWHMNHLDSTPLTPSLPSSHTSKVWFHRRQHQFAGLWR